MSKQIELNEEDLEPRGSFIFYKSYLMAIKEIENREAMLQALVAILDWGINRQEPSPNAADHAREAFWFVRDPIVISARKYDRRQKNRKPTVDPIIEATLREHCDQRWKPAESTELSVLLAQLHRDEDHGALKNVVYTVFQSFLQAERERAARRDRINHPAKYFAEMLRQHYTELDTENADTLTPRQRAALLERTGGDSSLVDDALRLIADRERTAKPGGRKPSQSPAYEQALSWALEAAKKQRRTGTLREAEKILKEK